ncbi:regulatory protein RecX [Lachnospiraceae bacterium LCP25S3_G4]
MIVTNIESVTKTKFKVYIEEAFAFVLYKGELSRFHIATGAEISTELVSEIKNEVVLKRAKLRALHLLNAMDRTESQLRTKLRQNYYTDEIIDLVIKYVESFGYIGDLNYARRFIQNGQSQKSKKEIYAKLCQKGIPKEIIEEAIEESYEMQDEQKAIRNLIIKKRFDFTHASDSEKQKMYAYLIRKGFRYEDIRQVIQVYDTNA